MSVDTNIILQQAIATHQLNDLYLAEKLYLSILKIDDQHPDANYNLGLLYVCVEQPLDALPLLRSALKAHPQIEQFWVSYFEALSSAGKSSRARNPRARQTEQPSA
jgi:tetratricopeptide (TPR) repeat protein